MTETPLSLDWEAIDASSVLRARRDVICQPVDDEAVLYDPVAGRSLTINQTAAAVWAVLDDGVALGELALEIADSFDVAHDEVESQLVALGRELGRFGLVEEVHDVTTNPSGAEEEHHR